jgi:hypothetical protein
MHRLRAVLANVAPEKRLDAVKDAIAGHLGAHGPHDDVTIMLVDLPPSAVT